MAKDRNQLTHVQFFKVCEEMRNHEEWFKQHRPTIPQAAKQLAEWCKFPVGENAVRNAIGATNVTWEERKLERKANQAFKKNSTTLKCLRVLTVSLIRLFEASGEKVPEALSLQLKQLYPETTNPPINSK